MIGIAKAIWLYLMQKLLLKVRRHEDKRKKHASYSGIMLFCFYNIVIVGWYI